MVKTTVIRIENDDHWHRLRADRVGASEAGALFGMHTYLDLWMLYKIKRKEIEQEVSEHAWWGVQDEAIIAKYLTDKMGYDLTKCSDYFVCDDAPLGCTPDYIDNVTGDFIQIKSTTKLYESDDLPLDYEVQLQVEMLCTGRDKTTIAIKYANRDVKLYERDANPQFQDEIMKRAVEFWTAVGNGDEPLITEKSAELAKKAYVMSSDEVEMDATTNLSLDEMVLELVDLRAKITEMDKRKEFLDAAIKQRIGLASIVNLPSGVMSAKSQVINRKAVEATTYTQRVLRFKGTK